MKTHTIRPLLLASALSILVSAASFAANLPLKSLTLQQTVTGRAYAYDLTNLK